MPATTKPTTTLMTLPDEIWGACCERLRLATRLGSEFFHPPPSQTQLLPVEAFETPWTVLEPSHAAVWLKQLCQLALVSREARSKVYSWAQVVIFRARAFVAAHPSMSFARASLAGMPEREQKISLETVAWYAQLIRESYFAVRAVPTARLADYLRLQHSMDSEGDVADVAANTFLHVDVVRAFDPAHAYACPRLRLTCPLPRVPAAAPSASSLAGDGGGGTAAGSAPGSPLEWEFNVNDCFGKWAQFNEHQFVDCTGFRRTVPASRLGRERRAGEPCAPSVVRADHDAAHSACTLGDLVALELEEAQAQATAKGAGRQQGGTEGGDENAAGTQVVGHRRAVFMPVVARQAGKQTVYRVVDEAQGADFMAIGLKESLSASSPQVQHGPQQHPWPPVMADAIFLIPAADFLTLVRKAYGVVHPSGPFWRNRFFASLLEPPGDKVDYTY